MSAAAARSDTVSSRPPIVIYSATQWHGSWRPRHEYALHLARRGWPVAYTTGPFSTWDRCGKEWKNAPILGGVVRDRGVVVDRPGRVPPRWPGRRVDDWVLAWHARKMRRAIGAAAAGQDLIAMVFDPAFGPHVARLQPRRTIYFQYEALGHLPGSRPNFERAEAELVQRADLIVSLTPQMAGLLAAGGGERARILPSAVRIEQFEGADALPCPADLATIPTPRIGYVGSITVALDFGLIRDVALGRPDWHLVFVGPVEGGGSGTTLRDRSANEAWQGLLALPNVHYLPPKPAAAVPAYMAHMQVNALWYRTTGSGWWLAGSPIKLYENLAVGRPVVGTRLAAVRDFEAVVGLADTAEEWLDAVSAALRDRTQSGIEARLAVARENSWERRVDRLEGWLLALGQGAEGSAYERHR